MVVETSQLQVLEEQATAGGKIEPAHDVQQRGLAAAGRPEQDDDLTRPDLKIDALQGPHLHLARGVGLGQVLRGEDIMPDDRRFGIIWMSEKALASAYGLDCCIEIRAPVTGRVLKIIQNSEAVVAAGSPLLEIGDPLDLEVVADLLSTDAVQIKAGSPVQIDGWGGSPVRGQVTRVDPAGFLKISALGIEEQRVRTTIDFAEPSKDWSRLGHDYRVIVHVTVWSAEDVLTVPVGALFRGGNDWAVYSVKDGRARTTIVKIGHRNAQMAEVVSGLSAGNRVVLHPSDRVRDGTAVAQRETR